MRKNIYILLGLALFLSLCSCADDLYKENQTEGLINFDIAVDDAFTRGKPVTSVSEIKAMKVYACYTGNGAGNAWVNHASTATPNFMNGLTATQSSPGVWSYPGPVYWPVATDANISFFAYTPEASTDNGISLTSTVGVPELHYTVPVNSCEKQPDLMVAVPLFDRNISNNGTSPVKFMMKHALTCVGFQVQGRGEEITGIAIEGVSLSGNLLMNGLDPIIWSDLSSPELTNLSAMLNTTPSIAGPAMSDNLLKDDGFLMMIPQILTEKAKLIISFKDGTSRKLSLNNQIWEAGKRINYQITITDGGIILVSPSNLGIPYHGTDARSRNITVTTNPAGLKWTLGSGAASWFKLSLNKDDNWGSAQERLSGKGDATVYTFAPENTSASERTTKVLYYTGKPTPAPVVNVIQFKKDNGKADSQLDNSYVGAFWRSSQTQERLIKIRHTNGGEWAASVVWTDGNWKEDDIFFSLKKPVSANPNSDWTPNDEDANDIAPADRLTEVNSKDNIRFRIGLGSVFTPTDAVPARYAVVALTHTNNSKIQYIYLRQGEDPDYLMRPSDTYGSGRQRTHAKRFATGNLTAKTFNAQTDRSGKNNPTFFTKYPTQSGAYFQWAGNSSYLRFAFLPTVNGAFPSAKSGNWSGLKETHESCPAGLKLASGSTADFRRPNNGAENAHVSNSDNSSVSEYKQSLFLNPESGNTSTDRANSMNGNYADGYFDRYVSIEYFEYKPARNYDLYASRGTLFFNPDSRASLFIPASGYMTARNEHIRFNHGAIYFSSSSLGSATAWYLRIRLDRSGDNFFQGMFTENGNKRLGYSIRCVRD